MQPNKANTASETVDEKNPEWVLYVIILVGMACTGLLSVTLYRLTGMCKKEKITSVEIETPSKDSREHPSMHYDRSVNLNVSQMSYNDPNVGGYARVKKQGAGIFESFDQGKMKTKKERLMDEILEHRINIIAAREMDLGSTEALENLMAKKQEMLIGPNPSQ